MAASSYATAAPGTVCCFLCHRYLAPEKLEDGRCADRAGCQRACVRMIGRPKPLTKREQRVHQEAG